MHKNVIFVFAMLFISGYHLSFAQGKIEYSKKEVKKEKNTSVNSTVYTKSSRNSRRDDSLKKSLMPPIYFLVNYTMVYTLFGSNKHEDHLNNTVTIHPFYEGASGNYSLENQENTLRIDVENNFLFESKNLYGNHLQFKIRPFQYFYVEGNYHQLIEHLPIDENEHLALFHLNLNYDRLRFEKFNLGWSIGANYMGNEVQKVGFNFGAQTDIFIAPKSSVSGEAHWGWINKTSINQYEAKLKYHPKNYFISTGYEHIKIGTPRYNFITTGIGFYF
jgi:hypothetical protein